MSNLPQLQHKYHITYLADTNAEIRFRPFTVGQQKQIMLIKNEKKKDVDVYKAIIQMIQDCIQGKIVIEELYPAVFEKLYYDIKTISNGNKVEFKCKCPHCKEEHEYIIDTQKDLIINNPKYELLVDISKEEQIKAKFIHVNIKNLMTIENKKYKSDEYKTLDTIAYCLHAVYVKDKVITEFTHEEAVEFIDNIEEGTFKTIANFFASMPALSTTKEFECESCKKKFTLTEEEVRGFLS
jgi:hypothetical protein